MKKDIKTNIGRRVQKSVGNEYGWISNIGRGGVVYTKPLVIALPGDDSVDDYSANAMAKSVETILGRNGVKDTDIQIIAIKYDKRKYNDFTYTKERYIWKNVKCYGKQIDKTNPEYDSPYIKDIYEKLLFPAIINAKGRRLNFEEVQKRFRNITLFSHCHGSFVACRLTEYLRDGMKKYFYNDDEIDILLSEITNIAISPRIGFHNKEDGGLKIGYSMLDDALCNYSYPCLIDKPENGLNSSLGIGYDDIHNDGLVNMYFVGDAMNYDEVNQEFCINCNYLHSVDAYIDVNYRQKVGNQLILTKNENGKNFTRIIVKSLQNALSLSLMGEKRTIDNVVSNDIPIVYKHNFEFVDIKFEGSNESFKKTLENFVQKQKERTLTNATQKLNGKIKDDNVSLNKLQNIK